MAEMNESGRDSRSWQGSGVKWPVRAVVTAGMPYGNKALHFGHVGGVFVPADCFARFLKDRIGADNVRFVSGTDCFGSPINEGYRKKVANEGFTGTIEDYVQANHDAQKATLDAFEIGLDIYEGSNIGVAGETHHAFTQEVIRRLYENGYLEKRETLQFYDPQAGTFLNGRQVEGHCPVQGCKGEKAYADECDLGHQFDPAELIAPKSTLTGQVPELRPAPNWYFTLPDFADVVAAYVEDCEQQGARPLVGQTISEFLAKPIIFVNTRDEAQERYLALADTLPEHTFREPVAGKSSFELEFANINDRDIARDALMAAGLRIRTGKTLVPFRITGNINWGIPVPALESDMEGLTVWCWPESLWAPISFTQAIAKKRGLPDDDWKLFWTRKDATVYQFIGQDNLYFYGVAQPALWVGLQEGATRELDPEEGQLQQSHLIANHHILYGKTKASSSGALKPPSANELLEHYTAEQLRAHFLALALDQRAVAFKPKVFDPDSATRDNPRISDPVLKEGSLLTKVFNRLARSCFYEAKNNFDCCMPLGWPSDEVLDEAHKTLTRYEETMARTELHTIMQIMDEFIRWSNKRWSAGIKSIEKAEDPAALEDERRQLLVDCFYLLRVCTLLMHPVAPKGCEMICEYFQIDPERFFSWDVPFAGMDELCPPESVAQGAHPVLELAPRVDFFPAHPSQFK